MRTISTSLSVLVAIASPARAMELAPVADTYIEVGREAAVDHGRSRLLEVDRSPFGVAYLRFDLRDVGGPVTAAVLRLRTINASRDAGHVYRIPVGDWEESLRWVDVDRNGDGDLDERDRSLLVPDPARVVGTVGAVAAGEAVEVDVTPAFAAGPAVYTLAVMNDSADGASFWSSEDVFQTPILAVTTDAPDPGPARLRCLSQSGPLLLASGVFTETWSQRSLARGARVDARAGIFLGGVANNYPITLGGGAGICLGGGLVAGQYDRSASWHEMHDENNAGVTFDSPGLTVDGVRIDNVTDGIRPRSNTEGFLIRGVHLSSVRDDCVENDQANGGAVEDSLLDGCYVAFSSRPLASDLESDGRGRVWRVENSLVRLAAMPGPRPGSNSHPDGLGHGPFFKVDLWDDPPNSRSPRFVLRNNTFRADRVGQESDRRMGIPPGHVLECENNVMVWLGPGDYPAALPSCFRVTKDRRVWDLAVADWLTRHGEP